MHRPRFEVSTCSLLIATCASASGQTTTLASVTSGGTQANGGSGYPFISADSRYVVFESTSANLVHGDDGTEIQIIVHDCLTGSNTLASRNAQGTQGNIASLDGSISANDRYVVFQSGASNLVPSDTNNAVDVFVYDLQADAIIRVSVDSSGAQQIVPGSSGDSSWPTISADGSYIAFTSSGVNLVPGGTNGVNHAFVHEMQTGITSLVSIDSSGTQGNADSGYAAISADGRFVAFHSNSDNLVPGDTNGVADVFVHDRQSGTTTRVSVDSSGAQGNGMSIRPSISADGRYVAFISQASNLVPNDTNGAWDVFVHDRQTGTTTRVSVSSTGAEGNQDSFSDSMGIISADGRFVTFASTASNLVPGDTNGVEDTFVHDRLTGETSRVSVAWDGSQADLSSDLGNLSSDGRYAVFESLAHNLIPGGTVSGPLVFRRDRGTAPVYASCVGDGTQGTCPCANNGVPGHGCDNSSGTGGALLSARGTPSLSADTFALTASGEKPTALSIVLQGTDLVTAAIYGDGLRCVAGTLKRLYVKSAVGGIIVAPQGADPTISARSATLGDPIPMGATRSYQVYYRDPDPSFCPRPQGNTYNITNSLSAVWAP
jgi:Tol biopolymer transport system component